jgi:hypothetical protein
MTTLAPDSPKEFELDAAQSDIAALRVALIGYLLI